MNVAVLASGAGTNLQALIDNAHGHHGVKLVAVASDKSQAPALDRARAAGITTEVFAGDRFGGDRAARDDAMALWLRDQRADLIVLAGYMQLVTPGFLAAFPDRVINIHPALLPAFPGLKAVDQALAYGVKVFGVTVHFVDGGVDSGPVIMQRAIELPDATERQQVTDQLQKIEHELIVAAVLAIARGAVRFDPARPRRVLIDR